MLYNLSSRNGCIEVERGKKKEDVRSSIQSKLGMTPLRGGRGLPAWEEVYGSDAIRSDTAVQSTECKNITWEDPNSHKNTSSWKADLDLLQKIVQREHLLSEMMDIFGKGKRNPASCQPVAASSTASLPSPIDSVSIVVAIDSLLVRRFIRSLRRITLEVVEAVEAWRIQCRTVKSHLDAPHTGKLPFFFQGENYLIKMVSDTDFLGEEATFEEALRDELEQHHFTQSGLEIDHPEIYCFGNPLLFPEGLAKRASIFSSNFPISKGEECLSQALVGCSATRVREVELVLLREVQLFANGFDDKELEDGAIVQNPTIPARPASVEIALSDSPSKSTHFDFTVMNTTNDALASDNADARGKNNDGILLRRYDRPWSVKPQSRRQMLAKHINILHKNVAQRNQILVKHTADAHQQVQLVNRLKAAHDHYSRSAQITMNESDAIKRNRGSQTKATAGDATFSLVSSASPHRHLVLSKKAHSSNRNSRGDVSTMLAAAKAAVAEEQWTQARAVLRRKRAALALEGMEVRRLQAAARAAAKQLECRS